ncbi:hypothetical protein JW960_19010 [candidate division KSB1 bacterium]|nr:hypothetical protein [candidate division KSB1 bacterium]
MLLKVTTICTMLLVCGEALALFIGVGLIKRNRQWLGFLNGFWLVTDAFGGIVIIYVIVTTLTYSWLFWTALIFLLLSHVYREYEYFTDNSQKFCANLPLFIMNNVKLTGIFMIFIALVLVRL